MIGLKELSNQLRCAVLTDSQTLGITVDPSPSCKDPRRVVQELASTVHMHKAVSKENQREEQGVLFTRGLLQGITGIISFTSERGYGLEKP
jgi:hypothetical protein